MKDLLNILQSISSLNLSPSPIDSWGDGKVKKNRREKEKGDGKWRHNYIIFDAFISIIKMVLHCRKFDCHGHVLILWLKSDFAQSQLTGIALCLEINLCTLVWMSLKLNSVSCSWFHCSRFWFCLLFFHISLVGISLGLELWDQLAIKNNSHQPRVGWWVPLLGCTPLGLQHTVLCFDSHSPDPLHLSKHSSKRHLRFFQQKNFCDVGLLTLDSTLILESDNESDTKLSTRWIR